MANLHNAGYGKHGLAFSASLLLVGRGQVAQLLLLQNYFWWYKRERTLAYVLHVPEKHWRTICTRETLVNYMYYRSSIWWDKKETRHALKLFRQTSNDKSSQCWIWKTWSGFLCIITFGWSRAGGATSAATKLLLVVQKREDIGVCTTCTRETLAYYMYQRDIGVLRVLQK